MSILVVVGKHFIVDLLKYFRYIPYQYITILMDMESGPPVVNLMWNMNDITIEFYLVHSAGSLMRLSLN